MKDNPVEQDKHRQAFELYQAAGPARTYGPVARRLGVAERTVRHWARIFHWKQRLRTHDQQTTRQETDAMRRSVRSEIEENLKIARVAKLKAVKAISEERVKPQFGDLARIISLEDELRAKRPPVEDDPKLSPAELRERARHMLYVVLGKTEAAVVLKEYLIQIGQLPPEDNPPPATTTTQETPDESDTPA